MQKRTVLVSLLASCVVMTLGVLQAQTKVDVAGTWKWTQPGRNGGPDSTNTLVLKVDGGKITGSLTRPGRGGEVKTDIDSAKLAGDDISFLVIREMNGDKMTNKFSGKVAGDVIKGKSESERNGTPTSREWEAKRDKK